MSNILEFPIKQIARAAMQPEATSGKNASILIFTGVRYERETGPKVAKRRRSKKQTGKRATTK